MELQDVHDGEVSPSHSDRTVAVDHFIIDPDVLAYRRLAEELRQRNIHTLIFSAGIDCQELCAFMQLFSERPKNIILRGGMRLLMEELGVVSMQNEQDPLRPEVYLVTEPDGKHLAESIPVSLTETQNGKGYVRSIEEAIDPCEVEIDPLEVLQSALHRSISPHAGPVTGNPSGEPGIDP